MLSVPAFDFAWQTYYVLKDPIELPKGSVIDCLAHFDNSDSNPYNPDSTKMVRWGEQTFEEMMIGYLDMDVPVGTEIIRGNDFRPRTEKATMNALQSMRRLLGGNQAPGGQTKKAAEKGAGNEPASHVPSVFGRGLKNLPGLERPLGGSPLPAAHDRRSLPGWPWP